MVGTLADHEIAERCGKGNLISAGFDSEFVKQACYELRAGSIYYVVSGTNAKRHDVLENDYILLKPQETVVILTFEKLNLPPDVLARVLTKGKLFTVGIAPVNTYADPGFKGRLGIVMKNLSHNYLKIVPGEPIAKIEFSQLEHPVEVPYHGQHGYETEIWPVAETMIVSADIAKKHPRVGSDLDEIADANGPLLGSIVKRIFKYERQIILCNVFVLSLVVLSMALAAGDWLTIGLAVGTSLVANVVFAIITFLATKT